MPSTSSKWKLGKPCTSREMLPPAVLHFDRNRDGVLVVFDQNSTGSLQVGGGVQRLPELAFAGGAVAAGDVDDFVAVKLTSLNWR